MLLDIIMIIRNIVMTREFKHHILQYINMPQRPNDIILELHANQIVIVRRRSARQNLVEFCKSCARRNFGVDQRGASSRIYII